jgi:S1-C subfamily serine protease
MRRERRKNFRLEWNSPASGDVVRADIVGTAPNYDLGVIRLRDLTHLPPPIAVSADLKVGQFAYAIGNPFGLDQSLTTGVIAHRCPNVFQRLRRISLF